MSRAAFTLLEMLLVVAIIAVVAGIGIFALIPQGEKANVKVAQTKAKALTSACEAYRIDHKKWPGSLTELIQPDEHGTYYLKDQDALFDPWEQPFQYNAAGSQYNAGRQPDIWTTNPNTGEPIHNGPKAR
jgi:prepilin-type N-terminal cleavage/methylation domain-containing protein